MFPDAPGDAVERLVPFLLASGVALVGTLSARTMVREG
jgi:hypothetical protein